MRLYAVIEKSCDYDMSDAIITLTTSEAKARQAEAGGKDRYIEEYEDGVYGALDGGIWLYHECGTEWSLTGPYSRFDWGKDEQPVEGVEKENLVRRKATLNGRILSEEKVAHYDVTVRMENGGENYRAAAWNRARELLAEYKAREAEE